MRENTEGEKKALPGMNPGNRLQELAVRCLVLFLFGFIILHAQGQDGGVVLKPTVATFTGSVQANGNLPLLQGQSKSVSYAAVANATRKIRNTITLSINEETASFIPADFTASVDVTIDAGTDAAHATNHTTKTLQVSYSKQEGVKYNAKNYVSFSDADYVNVTLGPVNAPVVGGLDTRQILLLDNELEATLYYTLNSTAVCTVTSQPPPAGADALLVNWTTPPNSGNNYTQIEWTWLEDDLAGNYTVNNTVNTDLLFRHGATRMDLPVPKDNFSIPLLYDGTGKLYYRVRLVNLNSNGVRQEAPWVDGTPVPFSGHEHSLNWQATTSFAEEGKYKSVVQYYDGSLRSRQTVTKNTTDNTTISAETFYDGEGRPAIQVLPAPGLNNVIAYTKNLNLFNGQNASQDDPADLFDFKTSGTAGNATPALQATGNSASLYYSSSNPDKNTGPNNNLPDAEGYPYTVTRYTPDGTGRILAQSGVGSTQKMDSHHETKYYYGTPSQEELDGLFGTEVGNYTHYFKNMVLDANGQMSVSYTDMHGRTIATALAGSPPQSGSLAGLDLTNDYAGQTLSNSIHRNLISSSTNVAKDNKVESVNTLLVTTPGDVTFTYTLTPGALSALSCLNVPLSYDCMYNLEFTIIDESGENAPVIKHFDNIDPVADDDPNTPGKAFKENGTGTAYTTIGITVPMALGSYTVRKTLTVSEASLQRYKDLFLAKALCKSEQDIIDSVKAEMELSTGCSIPAAPLTCDACKAKLGTDYDAYKANYLLTLNEGQPVMVTPEMDNMIRSSYDREVAKCNKLRKDISHSLETIRSLMLADMIPYSGQYATNYTSVAHPTMVNKYNIFSPSNGVTSSPFYLNPWTETYADAYPPSYTGPFYTTSGYYYDNSHNIDQSLYTAGNTLPGNLTPDNFTQTFKYPWTASLLPHHPEYGKLKFAEQYLQPSYDYGDQMLAITRFSDVPSNMIITSSSNISQDPFFAISTGDQASMVNKVTTSYETDTDPGSPNYNHHIGMWQVAYGSAVCKTITDESQRNSCYETGNVMPGQSIFDALSDDKKDQVWNTFKLLYTSERAKQINIYINTHAPLPGSDAADLVSQKFILRFPKDYDQSAQQYGWTGTTQDGTATYPAWYPLPNSAGGAPQVFPSDNDITVDHASQCSSYIARWKAELLQCPELAAHPQKDQIIEQIIAGMLTVCEGGSDEAHPDGASTTRLGSPSSFEEVVNSVFQQPQYNIPRNTYCNPFSIEYPKPYDKSPEVSSLYVSDITDCNCERFQELKAEAGQSVSTYPAFNQFMQNTYGESITQVLYDALMNCGNSVACFPTGETKRTEVFYNCNDDPPTTCSGDGGYLVDPNKNGGQANAWPAPSCSTYVNCPVTYCTTVLSSPQPLPHALQCGFVKNSNCIDCAQLSSLTAEFKSLFGAPYNGAPFFTSATLTDDQVEYNMLFARFVNYRTGFQYTWLEYAKAANAESCPLDNYTANEGNHTSIICGNTKPLNERTDIFIEQTECERVDFKAEVLGTHLYEMQKEKLLADFETAYRAKCLAARANEQFTADYTTAEYHYTLYYYDQAGNLVKTVPPKGVKPDFTNSVAVEQAKAQGNQNTPSHILATEYRYNSLNAVVYQTTPDSKVSRFWYDKLGRLAVSQNAKQAAATTPAYSYTLYDALGRITDVGQVAQATPMTQTISQDQNPTLPLSAWLSGGAKDQVTKTYYTDPFFIPNTISTLISQENLRNRVSWTAVYTTAPQAQADQLNFTSATFYTYDVHGNVSMLLQDFGSSNYVVNAMNNTGNRFKRIRYDYDLISGKVNMVSYQPPVWTPNTGQVTTGPYFWAYQGDAFYHRYTYDAENRLTMVETSRDSLVWERDAAYGYYKHGPLSRTVLGQLQVQGNDYMYTLQGWLKAVNPPTTAGSSSGGTGGSGTCAAGTAEDDLLLAAPRSATSNPTPPGTYTARNTITFDDGFSSYTDDGFETVVDGTLAPCSNTGTSTGGGDNDGQAGNKVAKDVVSYVLSYNSSDYKSIGDGSSPSTQLVQGLGGGYKPLYNGNIAAMGVSISKLNQPMIYNYGYDVLNRMVSMDAFTCAAGWQTLQPAVNNAYQERVAYDPNGNIKSYQRNGTSTLAAMDDLTYQYPRDAAGNAINNRLRYIRDNVPDANYPNDLNSQTSLSTAQVLAEKSAEVTTDYYQYDPIGNLIQEGDNTSGNTISWNVYGKIQQVVKHGTGANTITYSYDASGNRISKTISTTTTYYVRDATGNVMAVYEGTSTQMKVIETDLYGSSRLGLTGTQTVATAEQTLSGFGTVRTFTFTRGEKSYELSNHLGNVLSTISDRRQQMPNNSTVSYYMAEVTSATDYYPFGMQMPGRTVSSSSYRYGFNGKENDNDVKGDGNQQDYGMRIYDPRIGRWLSTDPEESKGAGMSPYLSMFGNPINLVDPDGAWPSPAPRIVDSYLRLNQFRYNAFYYAQNTSNEDLNNWARGRSKNENSILGTLGEHVWYSHLNEEKSDPSPLKFSSKLGYGKQIYGPLAAVITADVVTAQPLVKYTIPTPNGDIIATEKLLITRNNYDGTELNPKQVKASSFTPTVHYTNYEVKSVSPNAPKETILTSILIGVGQTLVNGLSPNMTGVLVVDKGAWMALYNDEKYRGTLIDLWKQLNKGGNAIELIEGLHDLAKSEMKKIKKEIRRLPNK